MLSIVLYGLLATGGDAAEIRRRQELSLAAPRVIVQPQVQVPQMQKPPMQSASLPPSQGTYYTRPPGPIPSNGSVPPPPPNQQLVIPGAQQGPQPGPESGNKSGTEAPGDSSTGDDQVLDSDGKVLPGGTGKDRSNTAPALLGPNDTPGPNSWADVLPNLNSGSDDHAPEDTTDSGVTEEVAKSTEKVGENLTDEQKQGILENTSTEEFDASPAEFQQLVLTAAQDKLADSEAAIDKLTDTGPIPEAVAPPSPETYAEIQNISSTMTETSAELSKGLRQLIDISLDELRNNATLEIDGPVVMDANGNPVPPLKRRWITAAITALGTILELTKLADKVLDEGIALWKKFKSA
ncbi:hypothetical protein TWF506_010520 [Arthrobotrys conoides]|uniref:Uncharacterized protein n=1 Tax=Arthrobotrys conoides TaxID=74498 RepID=A0AAN8RVV4_9PEZI